VASKVSINLEGLTVPISLTTYTVSRKSYLEDLIVKIDELVILECRDDLSHFLEDRESPYSLITKINSNLKVINGDLSRIRELLENAMG